MTRQNIFDNIEDMHRFTNTSFQLQETFIMGAVVEVPKPPEQAAYTNKLVVYPPFQILRLRLGSKGPLYVAAIILIAAGYTDASAIDNILSNLGSDLAPLLALFGEQVTNQYLSESLSWVDNWLFALAPLGIITAVVSAIRVAGGPGIRSLIGRGKENRGTVEAELMSSTSSGVCELWDGGGIVKVVGSPTILQLIYNPSEGSEDGTEGIYHLADAVTAKIYKMKSKVSREDEEALHPLAADPPPNIPPNLMSNIGIKPLSRPQLLAIGVLGTVLQASVLVFAACNQYKLIQITKNGDPIPVYSFYLILGGTLLLATGMFLCAKIIEASTKEVYWEPVESKTKVIWLQKGGQKVGEQLFGSFAKISPNTTIMTSVMKSHSNRDAIVSSAVTTSLVGFVIQFIGFRAMNPYVSLSQLGAILIMTAIRSCTRIKQIIINEIENSDILKDGQELDWLAKYLTGCEQWEVVTGVNNQSYIEAPERKQGVPTIGPEQIEPTSSAERIAPTSSLGPAMEYNTAMEVMMTRARLVELSKDWELDNRAMSMKLKLAIESTMNQFYTTIVLVPGTVALNEFTWGLPVKTADSVISTINLTLTRKLDEDGNWTVWRTEEHVLEAILCLWIFSISGTAKPQTEGPLRNIRLLGQANGSNDYDLWIRRGSMATVRRADPKTARYFGWAGVKDPSTEAEYLGVEFQGNLETLCAQDIYIRFMFKLATNIEKVGGDTSPRTNIGNSVSSDGQRKFGLINSNVDGIASCYTNSGLGTIEDAYMCIIPALRASGKLPAPDQVITRIRDLWVRTGDLSTIEGSRLLLDVSKEGYDVMVEWLLNNGMSANISLKAGLDRTALQAAAGEGHERTVQVLVRGGADINAKPAWHSGRSALQAAAGGGHEKVVRFLLASNAHVNDIPAEINGRTALQAAAQAGNKIIVEILIDGGAEVNATPGPVLGNTALQAAAGGGHNEIVDLLLQHGAEIDGKPAEIMGRTALQAAAENGHDAIVKQLLNAGADVNAAPAIDFGQTALQAAEEHSHQGIIEILLEAGANKNIRPAPNSGLERTPLAKAAKDGNDKIVQFFLEAGAAGAATDAVSLPMALQAGSEGGYYTTVKFLLEAGADVNAEPATTSGRMALQAAAGGGNDTTVKLLLDAGADVNAGPPTALQEAARGGHNTTVKLLLDAGADVNTGPPTALQVAAGGGHDTTVKLLLDAGAAVNAGPSTALQASAGAGHDTTVKLLLDAGAADNAGPPMALQAAAGGGHDTTVKLLLDAGAAVNAGLPTALRAAAGAGHDTTVKLLLDAGAAVNAGLPTALQAAAGAGHDTTVKLLLDAGADVNAAPAHYYGQTALQAAAAGGGHDTTVKLLLDAGADVNAAPAHYYGQTALQAAAGGGHDTTVKLLLGAGADVNAGPPTALQAAAGAGHDTTVKLLLDAGAAVNAGPSTALQAAAGGGHDTTVKLLLDAGADVNTAPAPNSGQTALQAAARGGHDITVKLLLEAGADVNAEPAYIFGRTALLAAQESGSATTLKLILDAIKNVSNSGNGEASLSS